jgi:PAS domain S-box-containing protein
MENLTKSIKNRYLIFLLTIVIIIISVIIIINHSITSQNDDAHIINLSGKQRYLSQRIANQVFIIDRDKNTASSGNALNKLKEFTNEWDTSLHYLYSTNRKNGNSKVIDSLFNVIEPYHNIIVTSSRDILNNPEAGVIKNSLETISEAEIPFFENMDLIVNSYEKEASNKLQKLKNTIYFLAVIAFIILLGELLFVLVPALKQLFKKNKELLHSNNELAISENKLKSNMIELSKLKTDLETKEAYNKILIDQAPTAIAMLDNNMCYMAASQRWITDYKMEGLEILGRSHYDLFPEIGDDWKENHQKCLNGAIDTCDEAPFTRADGSVQWIYWDVRPWYICEDKIGGLLMHTGDITKSKERDLESIRVEKILEKTNEVARIGTWEVDLIKNKVFWSKMVREIHEVPENYKPDLDTAINFFKEGKSRDTIEKAVTEAIEHSTSYDVEVELVTLKGAIVWTRAIGQAEIIEGTCVRLFGVFQDINDMKLSQLALDKAHAELKAILNSGPIAIITTDNNAIINHFNHGAELLLGYSASEMIGLKEPEIYHLEEELLNFKDDVAKKYDKDSSNFNPYMELAKNDDFDTREWTYCRKDGSMFPVQLTLTGIKNEQGENVGFLGVSFDITDRKKTQNELLRKNQMLNHAEEITRMGHWQWDTVADKVQWSNNLYKMFELNEAITDLNFNTYFNFVHADDKEIVTEYFNKATDDKRFSNFTHRISTNGKIKTVQLLGEVITNYRGEVIRIIGTCQDITEQKIAENKFRGLLESAPDAMVIVNEKGKIQLINKQAEKLFGYSADELLDKSVEILIPKRFMGTLAVHRDGFFAQPKTRRMGEGKELYGVNKKGEEIPIQISLSPLQTEEGLLVSAAIRDITAQKLAENELLRKNQLLNFAEKITMMGNWQVDVVNNTEKWSANLFHIYGVEENTEITPNTYFSFVHPDDKEKVAKHQQNINKNKKFTSLMHRIKLRDGTIKTILNLAEVITDNLGNIIEIVGTCQDVTAQRMAENKFRGLLESAPDAMVIVNEKGKIQLINKQAEKLFGYSAEELFQKPVEILIPERFAGNQKNTALRDSIFSNPKTMGMGEGKELFGINKKGNEIPIQISLSPLQTEEGLLVSAAIRDISAQKSAERKIIQAKEKLEILTQHLSGQNKQLADFAHITSHNLRSPVSNLNALLHLYDISESEEDKKELFEKFELVISHLTSTLNTLIEALKTRRDSVKELEILDFKGVLNKTKEIISGQIIKTDSIITSDFSKMPEIEYHKTYLESIFLNLVTNAIKYRSPDRNPEIHIETEIVNDKIKLTIRDNGLGIDLVRHGHKLFGLNKTFHRHPDAKGVGLYLTKIQIETMGGSIYATSEVNKGTVFTIIFNNSTNEKSL